jgi:hypothetical protein
MPRSVYSMETSIDATAIITDTEGFRKTAGIVLVRGPLMAQSRHAQCADECPLFGVKRTSQIRPLMSANDPKRTSAQLKRDFKGARKALWTEHKRGAAKLAPERTLY